MATEQLDASTQAFPVTPRRSAPASAAPPAPSPEATTDTSARRVPRHRRTATLVGTATLVIVAAGLLVVHALAQPTGSDAAVAALDSPQLPGDTLADTVTTRLVVRPDSTRLLVTTGQGAHYVARSAGGDLCLVRVPRGGLPSEVCVPDRVGADATIGTEGSGQVRLVADGGPRPSTADGWRPAGPNVWVRG